MKKDWKQALGLVLLCVPLFGGCSRGGTEEGDGGVSDGEAEDAGIDGDSDSDVDADGDVDSDVDGDIDGDSDMDGGARRLRLLWARQAGGLETDEGLCMASLPSGAVIFAGTYYDYAIFGKGEPNQTSLNFDLRMAGFVSKLESDGTLSWARNLQEGDGDITPFAAGSRPDGSYILAGQYWGPIILGKGLTTERTFWSEANDVFVAAYGADDRFLWARRTGGEWDDECRDVAVFADGSFVITGSFYKTMTFSEVPEPVEDGGMDGGGDGGGDGGEDSGVDGSAAVGGDAGRDAALDAGIDASPDAGLRFQAAGDAGPPAVSLVSNGSTDAFIVKYDADGRLAWARNVGGSQSDEGLRIAGCVDGSTIVGGIFQDRVVFGKGEPNETALTASGLRDIFLARFGVDGSLAWVKRIEAGAMNDVAAGPDCTAYVTGSFRGRATFGSGESNETTLVPIGVSGNDDVFLAMYHPDGLLAWAVQAGGVNNDRGHRMVVLIDGRVILGGSFDGEAVFGLGQAGEPRLIGQGFFVAEYDPDGRATWAEQIVESSGDALNDLAVSGNFVLISGTFHDRMKFGMGQSDETHLLTQGGTDTYLASYSLDGGAPLTFGGVR